MCVIGVILLITTIYAVCTFLGLCKVEKPTKKNKKPYIDMNTGIDYKYNFSFDEMLKFYPYVHIKGNLYLVRNYPKTKKFSFWGICNKSNYPPNDADIATRTHF